MLCTLVFYTSYELCEPVKQLENYSSGLELYAHKVFKPPMISPACYQQPIYRLLLPAIKPKSGLSASKSG